ncbi:MAG: hypothetical protein Q9223_005365 [Gallowayella weberi]
MPRSVSRSQVSIIVSGTEAVDSDYNFDESSETAPRQSGSMADEVAVASAHPSLDFPPDYPGYSKIIREAREHYCENNPPFTITTARFDASKERETVLAGPGGRSPGRITPDLLITVTRRSWSPLTIFWTVDYQGQRFIVKYFCDGGYKRWLGLE